MSSKKYNNKDNSLCNLFKIFCQLIISSIFNIIVDIFYIKILYHI